MKKFKRSLLLLSGVVAGMMSTPGFAGISDYIHISMNTEALIDSNVDGSADINHSHIGVTIGKESLQQILNEYGVTSFNRVDTVFTFTMRFSLLPYLLESSTQDTLFAKVDAAIAAKRVSVLEEVKTKVEQALNANPAFPNLPAAVQDQLRQKAIATAMEQADKQLDAAKKAKKDDMKDRLNDIRTETVIQEVALVLGKVVGDGTAIVYVKAGKLYMENGPALNSDNQSALEQLRAINSRIQRGSSAISTGALAIGMQKLFANGVQLRTEAYFFHDRMPFNSGKDYLAARMSESAERFKQHSDWWKIDSALLKALLRTDRADIYVVVGSFDGNGAGGAGAVIRITPKDTIYFDAFKGNRPSLGEGVSVFYSRAVEKNISVYAGVEVARDSFQPTISSAEDGKVSSSEASVGISWTLLEKKLGRALLRWSVNGEIFNLTDIDNTISEKHEGAGIRMGSQVNIRW